MALSAKLQLRQSPSLAITPQLLQAIRLLQMSSVELESFMAAEIEQNPLLGLHEARIVEGVDAYSQLPPEDARHPGAGFDRGATKLSSERLGQRETAAPKSSSAGPQRSDADPVERLCAPEEPLTTRLERWIEAEFAGVPADQMMASALLFDLDEAGYLATPLAHLAFSLRVAAEDLERVLRRCQELAPAGVFARNLGECLALQLRELNRLDPAMQALLDNLERLAAGDRATLCRTCGVGAEDLDDMIAEIRALDPKPGLAVDSETVRGLVPDVFVRPAHDGGWTVELNEAALPRLIVDRDYHARIRPRCATETDRRYIAECLQKATWLERSLDQRARTVLKVASEIILKQDRFLAEGVPGLRPLNLRAIADGIGMHESTVSRAAANKTMATPRGIFPFRFFFSGSLPATAGGDLHSAEAVKHRIARMIMEEPADAVLSDDAIVALLTREGVAIARRTVAKYREQMRLGSSVERRRDKRFRAAS